MSFVDQSGSQGQGFLKIRKRSRLWLRPTHRNHVWSHDFVSEQTNDGRKIKILNIIDEHTKECLASFVARRIRSGDIILILADIFIEHGIPEHIRSDNGPEFIAKKLKKWLKDLGVVTLFIEPGSPWENGYCESFNGKMRYQLLDGEIFYTLFAERKTTKGARSMAEKYSACQLIMNFGSGTKNPGRSKAYCG